MILTEEDIKTWNLQKLIEWLDDPVTQENDQFDFIENLQQRDEKAKLRIRKKFCSFANTNEGFLFFGINKTKKPVGMVNVKQEFTTELNRIVSENIFPGIPPQNYRPIHYIKNDNNRDIVVVKIIKSSRNLRPHMTNCKIYIRENGESKPIEDGIILKQIFSQRFYPYDIKQLEYDLEKIKNCSYLPDEIDFMYLKELKMFLEEQSKESILSDYEDLLSKFKSIVEKIEKIKRNQSLGNLEGKSISLLDDNNIRKLQDELSGLIDDFINQYQKVVLNNG